MTSWRALAERPGPLILVPVTADVLTEAAQGVAHHILIPVTAASADIELPPIDARTAVAALRSAGLGEAAAEEAGRLARRSLLSMRRSLANKPELHTPAWASSPTRTLRSLLLAGRWNQDRDADRAAVTELTGGDYDALRETVVELNRASDPFITQIGPAWMLVSAQDAWIRLRGTVRGDDLERLEPVLCRVLLERDPALDLSPDDRWYAATVGKSPAHSGDLRQGLAVTLVLLGIYGEVIDTGHGTSGSQWANRVVRGLLREANADTTGDTWNSLAGVLSQLAEAAPDAFLDGVRDAAAGPSPVIAAMFTDSGSAAATREPSRHHKLLWALERLAWSPDHFGRVTGLLARLAEIDAGGRIRNRPFNSLVTIFCLQYPETSASATARMAVIERLRERHPVIAWQLMMALLPSQLAIHDPTPSPEFRDWKPQEPVIVTPAELIDSIGRLVRWLIIDAGDDSRRWQQFLDVYRFLPEPDRQDVREALAARAHAGTLNDDGRADLWEALRGLIAHDRSRAGRPEALPGGELDSLGAIEQSLAPSDPVRRYGWLFALQLPDLGTGSRFSEPAYDTALREQRAAAVAEVEQLGLDAVREFAAQAVDARIVGGCLADATADKYRTEVLAMVTAAPSDERLAEGWLARRFQQDGWAWLDQLLAGELTPEQAALALLTSRDYPKAWHEADTRGAPVAEAFWRYFSISGLGHGFRHATEAAGRLVQAGRVAAALKLVVIYLDDLGGKPADFLIDLLSQFAGTYQSDPEIGLVTEYDFRAVFEYLNRHADSERSAQVGQLEWVFVAVLGDEPPVARLYEALTSDPDLFVTVVEMTWRASDAELDEGDDDDGGTVPEGEPLTSEQVRQAGNGYVLLTSIDRLPGTQPDGQVDYAVLRQWVIQVLERAAASGRRKVTEALIGQILASAPAEDDETLPEQPVRDLLDGQPIRDLLEELQSERVERELAIRLYNRRGVTARDPQDGGKQERELAERYRARAAGFSDGWPQTAAVLRQLAERYDTDAREEENRAERFRQGQQK